MSRIIEKVKKPKGDAIGGSYLLAHAKLKDQYKDKISTINSYNVCDVKYKLEMIFNKIVNLTN